MKTILKNRICYSFCVGLTIFIIECISYKLFHKRSNWLQLSLIWAIPWSIGVYFGKTFNEKIESFWMILLCDFIILINILLLANKSDFFFFIYDMISLDKTMFSNIIASFAIALVLNSILPK